MAANRTLIPITDTRLVGFGNLIRKESRQWWGTGQWLVQTLIWLVIVNGMMAIVAMAGPKIEEDLAKQAISQEEAAAARMALEQTVLMVYFVFSGLATAVGVVIIEQDAIIQERQTGTLAWILSKPVSRSAFLLAKLLANSGGVLVTMVLVQGLVAYFIYQAATGITLPVLNFAFSLGLVYLLLVFYLALTLLLGMLFRSRGAVIGIPMVLIFGNQLAGIAPWLGKIMPWNLVMDLGPNQPALAVLLARGLPLPTVSPILGTALLSLIFITVGLWRFQYEEL